MIDQSLNSAMTMRSGNTASLGRIDQYEILRELGGGGFGTVYLAKDTVSGVDVAVKGLPPLVKNNKEELENIRQNFALVSRLHHPGIAAALVLHPAGKVSYSDRAASEKLRVFEGDTLMVMEYAPGVTLSQWRRQFPDRRVPVDKAIAITRQIADALDYAHERKIIHRDIKPSNVMIETSADGVLTARVLDFGLAAEIRSSMGRVSREVHDTSGTRPYMAPEQWSGERQGAATDQYALAVLFHELVTGEVPFASVFDCGDPIVMLSAITTRPVKVPNDLPRAVRNALTRALGKEPGKRFDNCRQFVDALCPPVPPPPVLRTVVVALVLIVAIGTGAVAWHRHHQRQVAERLRLAQVEERRKADEASVIAAAEAEKRRVEKARAEAEARQRDEAEKKCQAETAEKRRREELAAKAEKEKSEAEARAKAEAAERKRQKELAAEKAKADEERRIAAEQERKKEELRKVAEMKEKENKKIAEDAVPKSVERQIQHKYVYEVCLQPRVADGNHLQLDQIDCSCESKSVFVRKEMSDGHPLVIVGTNDKPTGAVAVKLTYKGHTTRKWVSSADYGKAKVEVELK